MGLGGTVVMLALFSTIFFSWYFYIQARHKERLTLMEKGADASNFYAQKPPKRNWCFPWLKIGILFAGLSIGLAAGLFLISVPEMRDDLYDVAPGIVIALMFLFGGLGMVLAHFTDQKKNLQD